MTTATSGTTGDRTFTFDEILSDGFDAIVSAALTGEATAVLRGITVNTGLGGLGVAHGAEIRFEVEDLGRDKSDSDYITLTMTDIPGMFRVYEYLRLEDLMATILRARNYVMQAFDQLPFFVTDPNSPIYELLNDVTIPIINKSPRELLGLLDTINSAIDRVQRAMLDPDNDIQTPDRVRDGEVGAGHQRGQRRLLREHRRRRPGDDVEIRGGVRRNRSVRF